jgi:predicted dienelactone hydrolase
MQILEVAFLLTTVILLARLVTKPTVFPKLRTSAVICAALLLLVLHLILDGFRWQLIPGYFVFAVLLLVAFKKTQSRLVWRIIGCTVCGVLVLASAFLAQQLPVLRLPKPQGPFAVGTFAYTITDESRIESFDPDLKAKRELFVEVWYPAANNDQTNTYPVRPLWRELYQGPRDWLGFFMAYLGKVKTHSHIEAPIASDAAPYPVLLYNSAYYSWTSQNTLLIEHLVSYGYVVFSISHPYEQQKVHLSPAVTILANYGADTVDKSEYSTQAAQDYQRTWFEMAWLPDRRHRAQLAVTYLTLLDEVEKASDANQQKELIRKALLRDDMDPLANRLSPDVLSNFLWVANYQNKRLAVWVADTSFIANQIPNIKAPINGFSTALDLERLGAFGHSYGGAVAGEFCKIDARCKAGLNMDGTQFGQHWQLPMKVPFAMLYSAPQAGLNDFAYADKQNDFLEYTVAGAGHLNFTDFGVVMPLLKQLPIHDPLWLGKIPAIEMNNITNWVALTFFDRYLKNVPPKTTATNGFPELALSMANRP